MSLGAGPPRAEGYQLGESDPKGRDGSVEEAVSLEAGTWDRDLARIGGSGRELVE